VLMIWEISRAYGSGVRVPIHDLELTIFSEVPIELGELA
jgi:hypothetical protein